MYVLPAGRAPFCLRLARVDSGEIEYIVRVGILYERWESYTESKQWNIVYLHATEGSEPAWSWREPVTGFCEEARNWGSGNSA